MPDKKTKPNPKARKPSSAEVLMRMPNVGLDTDFMRVQVTGPVKTKTVKKPKNKGSE